MRSTKYACALGLVIAVAAGCGDNDGPSLVVETRVEKSTLAAGERVEAHCSVLDRAGEPALDDKGNPLNDSVEFDIKYESEDSFALDSEGQTIAARAGTATVRCSAPALDLVDPEPQDIEIVAGPPARVLTQLASATTVAGQPVGVDCLAFDAFNNPVKGFDRMLALSPFGAGTTTTSETVSATLAGEYHVSCVVTGAAQVDDDLLSVLPALPSSLVVAVEPERSLYSIDDQVTLVPEAHDQFGNRVDDVAFSYGSSAGVTTPSEAQFQFAQDGTFTLTATVTSPTQDGVALTASRTVVVDSAGPAIECRRADAPAQRAEAYMLQRAPSTVVVPVHVSDAFDVQSVTINGTPATLNANSGNYEAGVPVGFGMTFVDVVARDRNGKENSTTCFALVAENFTAEDAPMAGALAMRLSPAAITDSTPAGLNSLNDVFRTILGSAALRGLVDTGLKAANPINDGSCGVFACNPDVNYNAGTINWDAPTSTLNLVPGALQAQVTLPNVRLNVSACGTTCCIGGSNITVHASSISATVTFALALQGGVLRASLQGTPSVTVGSVSLDGSGFCGFLIDLLQGFLSGKVKDAVHNALTSFIGSNVAPLLDSLVSSLDVNTLGTSFAVPRLGGGGNLDLQFGLALSSLDITTARALIGIGTRFTPGAVGQNRASLGVPRRTADPLLDPPGTSDARPLGLALYEGVLNQVLHGLWRGGFFQAALSIGSGSATIDARLPPVAQVSGSQAQLMLGGIQATIAIPGIINTPIQVLFGGRATASVALDGDVLRFGNLALGQLYVSFQASLTQSQRTALATFLGQVIQRVLLDAVNAGLPAFPIPTFALPAAASQFGLPAGAALGILNAQLTTSGAHFVLTGGFGVRN